MKKLFVNGHGWSGSSAFIDLLQSVDAVSLIPGEFDDFRVPGSMREALTGDPKKIANMRSHRVPSIFFVFRFLIRGMVPDMLWPSFLRGKSIKRSKSANLGFGYMSEWFLFKKTKFRLIKCARSGSSSNETKDILECWFDGICSIYGQDANIVTIEQALLFDDDPAIYSWIDADKFIIFLRNPSKQLQSTKESHVLYSDYPWQAQFLIGSKLSFESQAHRVFIETSVRRYKWIEDFFADIDSSSVLFVDFDSFLYDFETTLLSIQNFLSQELNFDTKDFKITDSQARDSSYEGVDASLNKLINEAGDSYEKFKEKLKEKYLVV